jgi:hypothetical protein
MTLMTCRQHYRPSRGAREIEFPLSRLKCRSRYLHLQQFKTAVISVITVIAREMGTGAKLIGARH